MNSSIMGRRRKEISKYKKREKYPLYEEHTFAIKGRKRLGRKRRMRR